MINPFQIVFMASGIIIHVTIGKEKRTEFFSEERIRLGASANCDLQLHTKQVTDLGKWLELELENGVYRIIYFSNEVSLKFNDEKIHNYMAVNDGDIITVENTDISFSFFSLTSSSSLITTKREPHTMAFIESAALEAGASAKRDDAKVFLREFFRELYREISLTTKLIIATVLIGLISGVFYLGYSLYRETKETRYQTAQQNEVISKLEQKLSETNDQIGKIDQSNQQIIKTVSLAPNLRIEYGNGTCLIAGVYDLVDRKTGKTLRYPDPQAYIPDPYEPPPMMEESIPSAPPVGLTTEGNGTPVEYDFVGTGFHVGTGYIVTNRHVVQPWEEDDFVKQLMRENNGRVRIKRLVVFFPNFPQAFPIKVQQFSSKEDIAIGTIDPNLVSPDIPVLPLEPNDESVAVGKTVVSMGYPNGPDRLLAMVDDSEAKAINARFGNSRQNLINFLAQSRKIQPLTTQGAITDLDSKRIVHDAKTAEGGSGAPLFGQSGKVIGVNFGVFTENTAANMAVPIRYVVELLRRVGWKTKEEIEQESQNNQSLQLQTAGVVNSNANVQPKNP